jgi:hypothetical protein
VSTLLIVLAGLVIAAYKVAGIAAMMFVSIGLETTLPGPTELKRCKA